MLKILKIHINGQYSNHRSMMGCAAIFYEYEVDRRGKYSQILRIARAYSNCKNAGIVRAEFLILKRVLEWLAHEGCYDTPVVIQSSSDLFIKILDGKSKSYTKSHTIDDVREPCMEALEKFSNLSFEWIDADYNDAKHYARLAIAHAAKQ